MSGAAAAEDWLSLPREKRVAIVEAMIAKKMSRSQIGEALGVSRNTICGFCARNGLASGQPAKTPAPKGAEPGYGRMRPKNDRSAAGGHATRKRAPVTLAGEGARKDLPVRAHEAAGTRPFPSVSRRVPDPEPGKPQRDTSVVTAGETALSPPPGGVGFFDLKAEHCRWPLWGHVSRPPLAEMRFCGAPVVAGTSWCRACGLKLTAPTPGLIRRRAEAAMAA